MIWNKRIIATEIEDGYPKYYVTTNLGSHVLQFSVLQPPQHILRPVPGDAEVDGVHQAEGGVPDAGVEEVLDQGVSDPDHLGLAVPRLADESLVLKQKRTLVTVSWSRSR